MGIRDERPLKLSTRLIAGITFFSVVGLTIYIFIVSAIVQNAMDENIVAVSVSILGSAAVLLSLVIIATIIYTIVLFKGALKSSIETFKANSLAMASGASTRHNNTTQDTSFGLHEMNVEFNRNLDLVSGLIADISHMHNQHIQGNYRTVIDKNKYEGGFKTIVLGVNEMVEYHTSSKNEILNCITNIVNGDFEAKIRQLVSR
jgi:hypothetical protein